jgi:hypothetical protein
MIDDAYESKRPRFDYAADTQKGTAVPISFHRKNLCAHADTLSPEGGATLGRDTNDYFERARNSDLRCLKVESIDLLTACVAHEQG